MVQLNQAFNPSSVKSDLLPLAAYTLSITKTDKKPIKDKPETSQYVLEMDIQGGQYQGRKVFERLNLESTNDQAKNISERTLKKICEACGKATVTDLDELIGIPFIGHVGVKEGTDGYEDQNVVKKYQPMPSHAQTTTTAPQWPGAK